MIAPRFQRPGALPKQLHRALLGCPAFQAMGITGLQPLRMRRTQKATVYQLDTRSPSGSGSYWLKVHTQGSHRARKEYELLVDLKSGPSFAGVTSVEPVVWFEEHDALLTRHAEGQHLSRMIPNGFCPWLLTRTRTRQVARLCHRAGQWLGHLHSHWATGGPPDTADRVLAEVEEVLGRLPGRWQLPRKLRQQLEKTMRDLAVAVRPEEMMAVRVHGDFGTHNLLVAGDRLVVLDPSFSIGELDSEPYRSRFVDLTRFWSTIQGNTRANLRSAQRAELVDSFLAGYNEVTGLSVTSSQPEFRLVAVPQLLVSLRDWPSLLGRMFPRTRSSTLAWWLSR